MNEPVTLFTAFLLGLMGSVHCLGMCGGISAALGLAADGRRYRHIFAYNLGRIGTYTLIGGLAGLLFGWFQQQWLPLATGMRIAANLLLIAMGLYLANWWLGITRLEQLGQQLWRKLQPLGRSLLPVEHLHQALLLGALWGWLPCGLVYSALLWTASAGHSLESALLMMSFGFGTLPAMLATGVFASQLRKQFQQSRFRIAAGLLVIALGSYGLITALQHHQHAGPDSDSHQHHH